MRNYKMVLSYDGTRYRGWQRLGDSDNTIQGKLETVLGRMVDAPVEVIGSGRTDAGAHAKGQVANFHCDTDMNADEICAYLRRYLPSDIGVISVSEASTRFHSRLNAVSKTYSYSIWNSDEPCVFERKYAWILPEELDLSAMRQAAEYYCGTHDFLAFCSNKHFKKSSVRTVNSVAIFREGKMLRIEINGNGFLYNMVRIMVGTLVEVGRGVRVPDSVPNIFESRCRAQAGETAPPQGLCLMEVYYD